MSVTETLERIDEALKGGLEVFEDVDLSLDPACESKAHDAASWHDGPAALVIRIQGECPTCGYTAGPYTTLICRKAWDHAFEVGLRCANHGCWAKFSRDEWWTAVEVL